MPAVNQGYSSRIAAAAMQGKPPSTQRASSKCIIKVRSWKQVEQFRIPRTEAELVCQVILTEFCSHWVLLYFRGSECLTHQILLNSRSHLPLTIVKQYLEGTTFVTLPALYGREESMRSSDILFSWIDLPGLPSNGGGFQNTYSFSLLWNSLVSGTHSGVHFQFAWSPRNV